jgi:hypothetical protein
VIGEGAGRPEHAVLGVQLGGQSPARESGVQAVLGQPCGELTVGGEVVVEPAVADDVVHGAEPVVGPTDGRVEEGVAAVLVASCGPELEVAVVPVRGPCAGVATHRRRGCGCHTRESGRSSG